MSHEYNGESANRLPITQNNFPTSGIPVESQVSDKYPAKVLSAEKLLNKLLPKGKQSGVTKVKTQKKDWSSENSATENLKANLASPLSKLNASREKFSETYPVIPTKITNFAQGLGSKLEPK